MFDLLGLSDPIKVMVF